ncbi:hypothetical protein ACTXT7_004158 [Hymenolepis weldensis]
MPLTKTNGFLKFWHSVPYQFVITIWNSIRATYPVAIAHNPEKIYLSLSGLPSLSTSLPPRILSTQQELSDVG